MCTHMYRTLMKQSPVDNNPHSGKLSREKLVNSVVLGLLVQVFSLKIDSHTKYLLIEYIPYSQKYWREFNLAVCSQTDITKILADFNLAVRYGIAIHVHTYTQKKFWWILIWRL